MLKILVTITLMVTALITTAPVKAQHLNEAKAKDQSYDLTPRKLITLARHGRFLDQGIPSHSNFGNGIRSGRITAKKLVQSAIDQRRLPENSLSDRKFIKAVNDHMKSGGCGSV